jgi:MinD-like ATPase involved in chromosome partitioning or flagellar assembly
VTQIIVIHSLRGGTGKTTILANLAVLLAQAGQRVGLIDLDLQAPGLHERCGLTAAAIPHSLNEFLHAEAELTAIALDVTERLSPTPPGRIFLVPADPSAAAISRLLRESGDISRLSAGLRDWAADLSLDILLIDTHSGLTEETLLAFVLADTLALVLRPDTANYEGTAISLEVARRLEVPRLCLIVNQTPPPLDDAAVRAQVEAFETPLAAILPHTPELGQDRPTIWVLAQPASSLTTQFRDLLTALIAPAPEAQDD